MDLSQMTEVYQSMTVLGSIGGLALALLGAGGDKFGTRLWWDVKTDKPAW